MDTAVQAGRMGLRLNCEVGSIGSEQVVLKTADGEQQLPNDAVIVCAGGVLPTEQMRQAGIEFATKYGTA